MIIVTGAGSGIGRALAVHWTGLGHQVVGVGRRPDALDGTAAAIRRGFTAVVADVSTEEGRQAIYDAAESAGGLSCVVHNAARLSVGGALAGGGEYDSELAESLRVNVHAPMALTRKLLPLLVAGGAAEPRVLHISSLAAHQPFHSMSAFVCAAA